MQAPLGGSRPDAIIDVIDSLPTTINYNTDGTINYIEATNGTDVLRKTYSYAAGQVTVISQWVKQ